MYRHFLKDKTEMATKCMTRCLLYLSLNEMKIRTAIRYHGDYQKRQPPPKKKNAGKDTERLKHCWRECKLLQTSLNISK